MCSNQSLSILEHGSRGKAVKEIQELLGKVGCYCGKVNGYFNYNTVEAVRNFQCRLGITSTGIVEEKTWRAISRLRQAL